MFTYAELVVINMGVGKPHPVCLRPGKRYLTPVNAWLYPGENDQFSYTYRFMEQCIHEWCVHVHAHTCTHTHTHTHTHRERG